MFYSTPSGQGVIPFTEFACKRCPYNNRRCRGPNGGSILSAGASIGCLDPKRQLDSYANLHWTHVEPRGTPLPLPRLPRFIPQIVKGLPRGIDLPTDQVYGVALSTLTDDRGRIQFKTAGELRSALRLPWNAKQLLLGVDRDEPLEAFWERSEENRYWSHLKSLGFIAATSLTFSVWGDDPRFDQVYNQDRNEVSWEILNSIGIPAIPFFFPSAPEDYDRVAEWLQSKPSLSLVGLFARYYTSVTDLERLLLDAQKLCELVGHPYRHMVVGVASKEKIDLTRALLDDPIIVTAQPFLKGLKAGAEADEQLSFAKVRDKARREIIQTSLARYIAHFN